MIKLGGIVNLNGTKFEQGKVYSNPMVRAFSPQIKETIKEQDHEVSMAQNSLDTIIKNATELKQKIGQAEKNIPGWIQDHITNSENYIEQANSGYHELNETKLNEVGVNDIHFKEIIKFYDKGTPSTKKAVSIYVTGNPNSNKNQIAKELGGMDYDEVWDVMDHFKLTLESKTLKENGPCWKGYQQIGMKMKNGKEVPNCVPKNEGLVKEGRSVNSIQKDINKVLNAIQQELDKYKSTKGSGKEKMHVDNLKKLNIEKTKLTKELDSAVSGLYKDVELKAED